MSRKLLSEEKIKELVDQGTNSADTLKPVFERRRAVLKDTVGKLDSAEFRKHCQATAHRNHQEWKKAISALGKVRVIGGKDAKGNLLGDWGDVTQQVSKETGEIYAVLNMANAQEPGGGFLEGWGAQEENMFRRTDCYRSLTEDSFVSRKKLHKKTGKEVEQDEYTRAMQILINGDNKIVYLDKKNPRVCIKGNEPEGYQDYEEKDYFLFYELRSAAENLWDDGDGGWLDEKKKFNRENMQRKISAQLDTLIQNNIRYVVLSAFGCGAFGNPPEEIAQIYKEELLKPERAGKFDDVVFAIFYPGYGTDNFTPFYEKLNGLPLTQVQKARPSSAGVFSQSTGAKEDQFADQADKKSTGTKPGNPTA